MPSGASSQNLDKTAVGRHFLAASDTESETEDDSADEARRGHAADYGSFYRCPNGSDVAVWQLENIRQFT